MADLGAKKKISDHMIERAKQMRFNPLVIVDRGQTLKTHYGELYEVDDIRAYMESKDKAQRDFKNRALKYMIWLYSKDSILNTKPQDLLRDRKFKALDLAGFYPSPNTKKHTPTVIKNLVELKDIRFVRAVLAFLRETQKNELWSEIIVTEEQHFEALRLRMTPVLKGNDGMKQAEHKKKLAANCKELMIDIRQYWDEFWEDHLDLKQLGEDEIYMTIEDRAQINTGV